LLKPEKLKKNDKVAIAAPSQAGKEKIVNQVKKLVQILGLEPVVSDKVQVLLD